MSAKVRRQARRPEDSDLVECVNQLGNEWLCHALSTEPADREAAETAITTLYALTGEPPPEFVWVDSPQHAARILRPAVRTAGPPWPVESRIATLHYGTRDNLAQKVPLPAFRWTTQPPPPPSSLARARNRVYVKLNAVRDSVAGVLKSELDVRVGLCWYGQQEADWIAFFQTCQLIGDVHFRQSDLDVLEILAAIAKSCGWWWPRDGTCVIAERPLAIRTEPGGGEGTLRLHHESGPAVVYPDGWALHAWHGTRVPSWVIEDPTADRIAGETNIEVRRCAIERIGWPEFISQAGLALINSAPDPANPGAELRLYDLPYRTWGQSTRLLLAVNGSVERDGTRRQYGLRVPPGFSDPIDAAAWSYGLSGAQYAQLQRRT